MVSPGRNAGVSVFIFLLMTFVISAFCMMEHPQVRSHPVRFFFCRFPAPLSDLFVITAQQDLRDAKSTKLGGPRVLRTIEQRGPVALFAERFPDCRRLVSKNAGQQTGHRIYYNRGS